MSVLSDRQASRDRGRKLLVVTFHFPPDGAIGGLRWAGFTKYLAPLGWESTVVTAADQTVPFIAQGVTIVSVAPRTTLNDVYLKARTRAGGPSIPEESSNVAPHAKPRRGGNRISSVVRWARRESAMLLVVPDQGRGWILRAAARTRSLIRQWRPDVVVSSGPPHSAHFATWLATRGRRVRWIADLRDPWAGPITEAWLATAMHNSWLSRRMVQVMERTVVRAASDIVVNSRWLGDALGREYPSARVEWLPNGIDTEALPADVGEPYPGLSVAHLGTIYGERDLTPVLDALKDFLQKNPAARHDGSKMRIAGSIEGPRASELRRAIQERALESQVEVLGLIPRPEALRILARSRLCVVLAQGQVIEVPGKLYESIAMGVPTAILAPRDSASASEATRVGAVFIEQNDRAALAGLLQRAFDGGLTVPSDARAKIDYRGMASELDGLLRA